MRKTLTKLLSVYKSESETQLYAALREMIETQDKGRPRILVPKVPQKNALRDRLGLPPTSPPKKQPGRPTTDAPRLYRLTFQIVERKRKELAAQNRVSTIKAAIDAVNSEWALKFGEHESTFVAQQYQSVRSHYGRGKRLLQA